MTMMQSPLSEQVACKVAAKPNSCSRWHQHSLGQQIHTALEEQHEAETVLTHEQQV